MRSRHAQTHEDLRLPFADGEIFVRRWAGTGDVIAPVILLHDSLGSVGLWRDFPMRLVEATGRGAIAYDRMGFGKSSASASPLPLDFIERESEALRELREALGIDDHVLLGHSVGGAMALASAARFPQGCRAVVSLAAQAFVEDRTREGIHTARTSLSTPDGIARLSRWHGEKARWVLDAWTETWLAPAFADWSLRPLLGRITCPALVIHGKEDEYGSAAFPETISRGIGAHARMLLLEGVGHQPHREQADVVLAAIADFLRDG